MCRPSTATTCSPPSILRRPAEAGDARAAGSGRRAVAGWGAAPWRRYAPPAGGGGAGGGDRDVPLVLAGMPPFVADTPRHLPEWIASADPAVRERLLPPAYR